MSFLLVVRPRLRRRHARPPAVVVASGVHHPAAQHPIAQRRPAGTARRPSPARSRPTTCRGTNSIHCSRAAALTAYIDGAADPLWGWSGRGCQRADLVLVGCTELTPDGYYVVDVRVRVALIGQRAPGDEPRAIVMVGSGAATAHSDAAAAEEIEIPLPGWSARSDRVPDLELSGERSLDPSADPGRRARRSLPHPDLTRLIVDRNVRATVPGGDDSGKWVGPSG